MDEVKHLFENSPFHIVSFSETWLDSTIPNECVNMSGYTAVRKDRNRIGGGIIIYVKNNIFFKIRDDMRDEELELIVLQIELHKQKPFISSFDRISQIFQKIEATGLDVHVMGDLNCDFLCLNSNRYAEHLFSLTKDFNMTQHISANQLELRVLHLCLSIRYLHPIPKK